MKKKDVQVVVKANVNVAPNFYKMTVTVKGFKFKPGQFFQIAAPGHLLRRPFAVSDFDDSGFSFTYQTVGEGTIELSKLKKGDDTKILAPLGNSYKLPSKSSQAVLVGGGCGTPSLCLLANALKAKGIEVHTVVAARDACSLLETNSLRKMSTTLTCATDNGSKGYKGNAVEAVRDVILPKLGKKIEFFACGPYPMLRGLSALADDLDINCQVSLEEKMACGFGACMGCAVKVVSDNTDGFCYKRVCHDGPVFNSRELIWE